MLVKTGEVASVQLSLELGSMSETLTVTEAESPLSLENAQLQTSVMGAQVQDIPVNRDPNLFILTAPGVAPVSANNSFLGSGSANVNGGRGRGNNITVDGITATDIVVTGTDGVLDVLNLSSIKEVKVITNNFSAEYGRNATAQVLYITKSGTNALHGEAYEYLENNALNARPFFDDTGKANIKKQNRFGFDVGGPLYLPRIYDGRNRTFFDVNYEGGKLRGAGTSVIARVPTPAMLAAVTDPTAKALVDQYKLPSSPAGSIQNQAATTSDSYKVAVRVDQRIGDKDTIWGRYSRYTSTDASAGNTFIFSNLLGFGATSQGTGQQATLQEIHLFSPTVVNEFRFGFGRSTAGFPIVTPYALGPRIQFSSNEVDRFGVWEGLPQDRSQNTYQFTDNLSMSRGRHTLKMGMEYYFLQSDGVFDAVQRGIFTFPSWADFAAGSPTTYQQRLGDSNRQFRVKNIFGFLQDDWKAARNLTVNLGLRYEWAGGPTELTGKISNLNLNNTQAFGAAGSGPFGLLEQGKPSFKSNNNWGPRIGFAWNVGLRQKTVVRGGYGIAYDFIFLNPITNQRFLPPLIITGTLTGQGSFAGTNSFANLVAGTSQLQADTKAQVGKLSTTVLDFGSVSPAIAQNLRNPQVHQWNLGIEHEIFGLVVKASYVGTKGNYLSRSRDINLIAQLVPPATSVADETARLADFTAANSGLSGGATKYSNRIDRRYNVINLVDSSANSNYHSGQFEVLRRYGHGLMLNANYTFAKSIDDGSDVLGVLVNDSPTQQNPRDNRNNRGPSQFDLRHRLVISHTWELPFFKASSSSFLKTALGGWAFSGTTSFRSGFPVTLATGARRGLATSTVLGGGGAVRPNVSGPVNIKWQPSGSAGAPYGTAKPDGVQSVSTYATSLGLSQPLLGNFGAMGRNVLRLNREQNFNWNVYKRFALGERMSVQIRAEMYNVFNNTAFQDVDLTISSPTFGQYIGTTGDSRYFQLGARFMF